MLPFLLSMATPPWHGPMGWPPGLASKKLGVMAYLNCSAKAVVDTRAMAANKTWEMRRMIILIVNDFGYDECNKSGRHILQRERKDNCRAEPPDPSFLLHKCAE